MYIVVLVVPPPFARGLAVVGLVTGLPGATYTIGWLRYDILEVLVPTYDIIFFDFIVVSTFGTFKATLGDARVIGFLPAFVANQFNVFIDANTQSVRITMIMNAIAFVSTMGVAVCSAFGVIPDFPDKIVLSYGVHYMNSHDYLTNGFITTGALMLRTLYRKRADLLGRSRSTVIQCVSYRCYLRLRLQSTPTVGRKRSAYNSVELSNPAMQSSIQVMQYVPVVPLLRARRVVFPIIFQWLVHSSNHSRASWIRAGFRWLGWIATSLTLVSGTWAFVWFEWVSPDHTGPSTTLQCLWFTALLATSLYITSCFTLYQRQLVAALCSYFDFVFLSFQLTFAHVAIADVFNWRESCVLLVLTWLWFHWVFFVDALTPIVRDRLGLTACFIKVVCVVLVLSSFVPSYLMVFSKASSQLNDRIIWEGFVLGHRVQFRLIASFYSCYFTVICCLARLLFRVLQAGPNELTLLDGPVAYNNPHRKSKRSTAAN